MDSHSVGGLRRSTELLATPGAFMPCDQDNGQAGSLSKAIRERERAHHNFAVKLVGYLFFFFRRHRAKPQYPLRRSLQQWWSLCLSRDRKFQDGRTVTFLHARHLPPVTERGEEFSHPQTLGTTWVLVSNPSLNDFCNKFSLEFIWPLTI